MVPNTRWAESSDFNGRAWLNFGWIREKILGTDSATSSSTLVLAHGLSLQNIEKTALREMVCFLPWDDAGGSLE
jgi:hypothetical protein